jgi:hypothetical protein
MTQYTELEAMIYLKRATISHNAPVIVEIPKYHKSQIKEHIILFIKDMINKHSEDITIELLLDDVSKLFTEWRNSKNLTYEIDNTNLGVLIYHLKINGITKGKRKNTGNTKRFNIKQIKEYFKQIKLSKFGIMIKS